MDVEVTKDTGPTVQDWHYIDLYRRLKDGPRSLPAMATRAAEYTAVEVQIALAQRDAQIVAWLRGKADAEPEWGVFEAQRYRKLADAIEQGIPGEQS